MKSQHWYTKDGVPMHYIQSADGSTRPTTLRDARKLELYPSVSTVLEDVLGKPGLERYFIRQAVMAVVTAPDRPGESLDSKIERVLEIERQQEEEAKQARDLGTLVHKSIHAALTGQMYQPDVEVYVKAALAAIEPFGKPLRTEFIVVGSGYAGCADLLMSDGSKATLVDFKTCKNLPRKSWPEHKLQLAAYAGCIMDEMYIEQTANVYISKAKPGSIAVCINRDWMDTLPIFSAIYNVWCWLKNYYPHYIVPDSDQNLTTS